MIEKVLRALLLSAVATAGAVLVMRKFDRGSAGERAPEGSRLEVDADRMADTERAALIAEFEALI